MATFIRIIWLHIILFCEFLHLLDSRWFIIIRSNVYYLNTLAFFQGNQLRLRKIAIFLFTGFFDCPIKHILSDKIRHPNHRNKLELFFVRIINASVAILPPKAFKWRYDKVKIVLDLVRSLLAHLDGISNTVQKLDCLLILAIGGVGITFATH